MHASESCLDNNTERAAWRHQKDVMLEALKAENGGVLPSNVQLPMMPPPTRTTHVRIGSGSVRCTNIPTAQQYQRCCLAV